MGGLLLRSSALRSRTHFLLKASEGQVPMMLVSDYLYTTTSNTLRDIVFLSTTTCLYVVFFYT